MTLKIIFTVWALNLQRGHIKEIIMYKKTLIIIIISVTSLLFFSCSYKRVGEFRSVFIGFDKEASLEITLTDGTKIIYSESAKVSPEIKAFKEGLKTGSKTAIKAAK